MFQGASNSNQDISGWDVSYLKEMHQMFLAAVINFDRDLTLWDTCSVTTVKNVCFGASNIDQDLCWDLQNTAGTDDILELS